MNKRYSLNKMSGMGIAAGGLVVGGFTLPGFRLESARASDALLRTKHSPGISGKLSVIDIESSLYYGDRLRLVSAPVIPNMDKIKVDLAAFWAKVKDEGRSWYRHSAGGVSRKPLYKGQSPILEKIVVSGYGVPV